MTCTSPNAPTMTFDGLRSRWITPLRMGVSDGLAHLLEDGEERPGPRGVGPLLEQRGEGPALDEPHREERPELGIESQFITGTMPGMLELAADLGLLDEPLDHPLVPGMAWVEHLDRDVAAEVGIAPFEDDAHSTPGDLAMEVVAPGPPAARASSNGPGPPPATVHRARRGAGYAT